MRTKFYAFIISSLLCAQSSNATLTIYKDGTALIKQPVSWEVFAGNSDITWNGNSEITNFCFIQKLAQRHGGTEGFYMDKK